MGRRTWTYQDEHTLGGIIDDSVWKMSRNLDQAFPGVFSTRYLDDVKGQLFTMLKDRVEQERLQKGASFSARLDRLSRNIQGADSQRFQDYDEPLRESSKQAAEAMYWILRSSVDADLVPGYWSSSVMVGLDRDYAGMVLAPNTTGVPKSSLTFSFRASVPPNEAMPASVGFAIHPPFGFQEARESEDLMRAITHAAVPSARREFGELGRFRFFKKSGTVVLSAEIADDRIQEAVDEFPLAVRKITRQVVKALEGHLG